jgi:hypothetical protein
MTDINHDELFMQTYDRHHVYEMMLNPLLFKGIKLSEVNPTAAIQTAWSPPGVADVGYSQKYFGLKNVANCTLITEGVQLP